MLTFEEWLSESVLLNKLQNKYEKAMKLFLFLKDKGEKLNHAMHTAASNFNMSDKEFHDYLWKNGYKI